MNKTALRRHFQSQCTAFSPERRQDLSKQVAVVALSLAEVTGATCVGLFAGQLTPYPEVDTSHLHDGLRKNEIVTVYPRVEGNELAFVQALDRGELILGRWGIKEPADDARPVLLSDLDALIVPGVAFTSQGHRLGRGGGFYDRTLARAPETLVTVGLAFGAQIAEYLPMETLDRPVDFVVTELGVLNARQPRA
jgi:5-formyltetrahydrofolate cyclo-ligase